MRLEKFWPTKWPLKFRLLSAGISLSILVLAMPLYMRSKLSDLSEIYYQTTYNWELLGKLHKVSHLLSDSESKLRAYISSGHHEWLASVDQNKKQMGELLEEVKKSVQVKTHNHHLILMYDVEKLYQQWLEQTKGFRKKNSLKNASTLEKNLFFEPIAIHLQDDINELAKDIQSENMNANKKVLKETRFALVYVTYGGLLFFLGFATLMLSMWFTLMPDLNLLLEGVAEIKKGNLDYRVYLTGHSETARLGRAFNEMVVSLKAQTEKLTELNRLKSDFVSTVSHELRTPLTAIKGSIGLILGGITGDIPSETSEMLKITQKNTDRLIRLINEVLDVAKIEAGQIQMHFDKYSLVETINHAVLGIEAMAQSNGIRLTWQRPSQSPLVVIDKDRIVQVITNLLSNAIKFTEPGGEVSVSCDWQADCVVVRVTDTGQGISEEFLDRIFEKFQQAEGSAHKQKEGTGLGLTITRAIIEEHGGKIAVTSKVGSGTTFTFELPWNGTEMVEIKKASQESINQLLHQKTILLVDDEIDFLTVTKKFLENEGYVVLTAANAQEALKTLAGATAVKPDLILLDYLLPDMNGMELRNIIRQNHASKDIPIVFVTIANDIKEEVAVIKKPIVEAEFRLWLKTFFESSYQEQKLAS